MSKRFFNMGASTAASTSLLSAILYALSMVPIVAQSTSPPQSVNTTQGKPVAPSTLPKDYVIGVEDIVNVVFWRDKELSSEVVVRPDGKISLPMLNDVSAAGMTPEQLASAVQQAAAKFVRDPGVTVMVKEIRSRKVYVIGEVAKPGTFPLASEMNVMQMIAQAGGFVEGAKKGDVTIVRIENGQERRYKFNYNEVVRGKNIGQNIRLLPGDTVLVR